MLKAASGMLLVLLVIVAVLASSAATALAGPGAITGLAGPAYANSSIPFSWNPVSGIAGYSYVFDRLPGTLGGSTVLLSPLSFASSQVTAGSAPWQVVAGDFGNGTLDLAVLNQSSNSVTVFLGDGHGVFTLCSTSVTGKDPHSIALGDFNGDGRPDLAVANYDATNVSVLLANGVGTFATRVNSVTGTSPHGIAAGDLNGDGKADLVVANAGSNTVSVLLGKGDGTFQPKVDYATGAHAEKAVIADFNGDGNPDLAVINNSANSVSMLLGNGDGTFTAGKTAATGQTPYWLAAGDLGNGRLDLVVANYAANTVSVLLGKGNGTFVAKVDYPVGSKPIAVAIADINGDSLPDLVATDHADGSIAVLLGRGNATFAAARFITTGSTPRFFTVGDFNGDGSPDLAVPFDIGSAVGILLNTTNSAGPTVTETGTAEGVWYFHVCAVDVTGNPGPTSTRQVLIDTTAPTTTDNAPAGWQDHAVAVTLTPTDTGSGMSGGQAGTWYSLDGGAYTPGSSIAVTGEGSHTVAYYSKDFLGNAETPHSATVLIDTTAPATTADAPTGWQDHAVTVTLTPTDSGSGMAGGQAGTWYSLDGGPDTPGTSVDVGGAGIHTVSYYSKDFLGNAETPHSATVKIDTSAPVTTDNAPSGWQDHPVTVTLTPSDAGSGMAGGQAGTWYSLDGGPNTPGTSVEVGGEGGHTVSYYSKDFLGNAETPHSVTVLVDTTAPVTTDNAPGGWQHDAVTVTLTPTDADSGMSGGQAGTWYSLDGGPDTPGTLVEVIGDGAHALTYYSRDAAGNAETARTVSIEIDTTAPATTDDAPADWQDHAVTVTLTPTDTGSGMSGGQAGTWYSLDSAPYTPGTSVEVGGDGSHTVSYYSKDSLGNAETPHSVTVLIDTTAPATRATDTQGNDVPGGWIRGPFTVEFSASDGDGSGVQTTEYSTDGGATWQTGSSVIFQAWKRGGGSGSYLLSFRSIDTAGNVEASASISLLIDTSRPTSSDDAPTDAQSGPVTVDLKGNDSYSGVAFIWYSLDGGDWTQVAYPSSPEPGYLGVPVTISGDGLHTLRYYAVDGAGNPQVGYRVCAVTIQSEATSALISTQRVQALHRIRPHAPHRAHAPHRVRARDRVPRRLP